MSQVNFDVEAPANTPKRELTRARKGTGTLQELWERLSRREWQALFAELERTLHEPLDGYEPGAVHPLTNAPVPTQEERARIYFLSLLDRFEARRRLLSDSLTAPQVARLLGSARQTPLTRLEADSLLAVYDRGVWRFPAWQFDPEGPAGVVAGLPEVLRALADVDNFARLVWLTKPNPYLDKRAPIDALRSGEVERVVNEARATAARQAA